MFKILNLF